MNRITFMASGYVHDRCTEKELQGWQNRCNIYGIPFRIQMDGHGTYLEIDDTADPLLPKRKPAAEADGPTQVWI